MGWSYTNKPQNESNLEFFRKLWEDEGFKIIDGGTVHRKTFYGVCERQFKSGEKTRFVIICLLDYRIDEFYNFGYKDMDETCGPNERECPERLLKLLEDYPPNDSLWATEWRKACWDKINAKKALRKKINSLRTNDIVEFEKPFRFLFTGEEAQTFRVVKEGKRIRFEHPKFDTKYVIRTWKKYPFKIRVPAF